MSKRNHLPAAIAAALSLCSVPVLATETCYDFSRLPVGTTYHIGDRLEISTGEVRIRNFIKDGAVFTPINPIDQHFEVTQSQIALGISPEAALTFVGVQLIPDVPVREITLKVAQQLGVTQLLPAYIEVNGEVRDFEGSFEELDGKLLGNVLEGRARFNADLIRDEPGPNGPSFWHRGTIRVRATLGDIDSFTFGAQIMHFDEVCLVY